MRQVPGNVVTERPLDEQADMLVKKLAGHNVFARMRGKVQGFPLWQLLDLDSDNSPTQSLREFDAYMRDLRIMRNLVVWLRHHGYRRAGEELQHALSNGDYRMWCEDVPLHESETATVVVFEPAVTFSMYKWRIDAILELHHLDRGEPISRGTRGLVQRCPSLTELGREETDARIFRAIRHDIVQPLLEAAQPKAREVFSRLSWYGPECYPLHRQGCSPKSVNDREKAYGGGAWAYILVGHDQGEVISWFPRELQAKLATWQVQVPRVYLRGVSMSNCRIGFYPEAEHARWQKLSLSRASRGVAAGMGVVVAPTDDCEKRGRFVLQSYTW